MLTIEGNDGRTGSWHVGEEMNIPEGQIITFQADGHELIEFIHMFMDAGVTVNYPAEYLTPVL